jgi:hypothetical protein
MLDDWKGAGEMPNDNATPEGVGARECELAAKEESLTGTSYPPLECSLG